MKLINCPACKKEISNQEKNCPHCGYMRHRMKGSTKMLMIIAFLIVITTSVVGVSYYSSLQALSKLDAKSIAASEKVQISTETLAKLENEKRFVQVINDASPDLDVAFGITLSVINSALNKDWSFSEVFIYLYSRDKLNNEWQSYSNAPVGMHAGGFVLCNGSFYSIGGSTSSGFSGLNYQYEPATNQWTEKAPMHFKRMNVAVVSNDNKIYAIGGDPFLDVNEVYDPITDIWTSLKPMPTGVQHVKGVVVNGKIYVMGGLETWSIVSNKNQVYDIATDSWLEMAAMPIGKHNYSSIVHEEKIYVFGGGVYEEGVTGIWGLNSSIEVYDTKTDTWAYFGEMPTSLFYGGIVVYGDEVIILGGFRDLSVPVSRVDILSLKTKTWSKGVPIPQASVAMGVVEYKKQIYVSGGADSLNNWIANRLLYQIPVEAMFKYDD